jgi:hypothetical protein
MADNLNEFDVGHLQQVDEEIFCGDRIEAIPKNVLAVLDLSAGHEVLFEAMAFMAARGLAYGWMPRIDGPPVPSAEWINAAVLTVEGWRQAGWPVLLYCANHESRAALVDIAYHMKVNGWSRDKAFTYTKGKRHETDPNSYFMAGLWNYETWLEQQLRD